MRIVSKHRDYYDGVMAYGTDPKQVYVRSTTTFNKRDEAPEFDLGWGLPTEIGGIRITAKQIGFCGFIYEALEINRVTFYRPEDVVIDPKAPEFTYTRRGDRDSFMRCLALTRWNPPRRDDRPFIQLGVPIFREIRDYYNHWRFTLHPILKNDMFQKVKHPFDAYQEISAYLSCQLAVQVDPPQRIPDDIMRDKKGFDKWSFRKPGKKGLY